LSINIDLKAITSLCCHPGRLGFRDEGKGILQVNIPAQKDPYGMTIMRFVINPD
jgi:hypothetical protein